MSDTIEDIGECFKNSVEGRISRDECMNRAEAAGLEQVGRIGGGRVTFDIPETDDVVKFPVESWGMSHNIRETELWEDFVETGASSNFAPVDSVNEDGSYLVMGAYPLKPLADEIAEVKTAIEESGWECRDMKPRNFGMNNEGDVRFIDYGDGCRYEL